MVVRVNRYGAGERAGCAGAAGRRRMRRQAGLVVYLGVSRGGGPDKPASGEMGRGGGRVLGRVRPR